MKTTIDADELRRHIVNVVDAEGWTPWSVTMCAVLAEQTDDDEPTIRRMIDGLVDAAGVSHSSYRVDANRRTRKHVAVCSCGWRSAGYSSGGLAGAAYDVHVVEVSK